MCKPGERPVGKTLVLEDGTQLCEACFMGDDKLRGQLRDEYFRPAPLSEAAKILDQRLRTEEQLVETREQLAWTRRELARIKTDA